MTVKLGVECLFHLPKAEMSQMTSRFTSVLNGKGVEFELDDFLGLKILSFQKVGRVKLVFGGGWIEIFSLDCPEKSHLMIPIKIQINTSLKYSFIVFPCEQVYVSGWDVASYRKQMS